MDFYMWNKVEIAMWNLSVIYDPLHVHCCCNSSSISFTLSLIVIQYRLYPSCIIVYFPSNVQLLIIGCVCVFLSFYWDCLMYMCMSCTHSILILCWYSSCVHDQCKSSLSHVSYWIFINIGLCLSWGYVYVCHLVKVV